LEPDTIVQASSDAIAARLEPEAAQVGVAALGERKHLEPAALDGLRSVFGERAAKSRRVKIPHWESVGNVDVVVTVPDTPTEFSILGELKWCGTRPVLFEAVWDCFNMALGTLRPEHPRAYLITGAHTTVWETSPFAVLFETHAHDPVELCMRDIGGRDHWLAWDALLYGGKDRHPDAVPAAIRTTVVARAPVGDGEIRVVEVAPVSNDWIPFANGWPRGERPSTAHRPLVAPASRFIDTDEDIQWDPAYDPANADLISQLREIGAWPDDYPAPLDFE
jgi:hypothetical protein